MFGEVSGVMAMSAEQAKRLPARVNLRPNMSNAYPAKIEPRIAPG